MSFEDFGYGDDIEYNTLRNNKEAAPAPAPAPKEPKPQRCNGFVLIIKSMPERAKENDILRKFSEFGKINDIHMEQGYALIVYERYTKNNKAEEAMKVDEFLGQKVNVNWCFVKVP